MSTRVANAVPAVRVGDAVFTLFLLAVFVFAYVQAQEWPFRARLFPELLSVAGIGFTVLKLVGMGVQAWRHHVWKARQALAGESGGDVEEVEEEPDHSLEYAFGTASRRAWAAALAWAASFFVLLWLSGVFVAVPVFALLYLRIAGKASWLAAALYAGIAAGVLWLVFRYLLSVPMPVGIF